VFEGYAAPPAVYLILWEYGEHLFKLPPGSKPLTFTLDDCKAGAKRALKSLHQYARIFPIGKPRALLWQGFYDWLNGKTEKALKTWHKGLAVASSLGLPWEEGRVHYEIGRRTVANISSRQEHLTQALEIFKRLGSEHDQARVERELRVKVSQE
jgi:hypothetical protein